jgi:uncharacterized repeat protein (TIGR02543 family)/LPXTG-motif cell wall-anchored protein
VEPTEKEVVYKLSYGKLPVPVREGYSFLGWYTAPDATKDAGSWIAEKSEVTNPADHKLYAQWSALDDLTVIFDPVRGTVAPGSKAVVFDSPYGALPIPLRPGYVFVGWYTDEEGGFLIEDYVPVKIGTTHVLYAHWKALPTPPVIIPVNMGGGDNIVNVYVTYTYPEGTDPTVPQYPSDPNRPPLVGGETVNPPATGDDLTIALLALLALTSSLAGAFVLARKRRRFSPLF